MPLKIADCISNGPEMKFINKLSSGQATNLLVTLKIFEKLV